MSESLTGSSEKVNSEITYKAPILKNNDREELADIARSMISRIEKYGTIDGFPDENLEIIMETAISILTPLPAMVELTAPIVVFGDLHGQLSDFLKFVTEIGRPPVIQFLFLGDVVDRGTRSLEIVFWILCTLCLNPLQIHWIRGNHEVQRVNRLYGFREELLRKRDNRIWKMINDIFTELPVCANINRKILCMHGGLSPKIIDWQSLTQLAKPRAQQKIDEDICLDLLWADPNTVNDEYKFNTVRGISSLFSESMVKNTCRSLGIDMILRAHEVKMNGHEFQFNRRLLTVFSAPHYCGKHPNSGSVAQISRTLKLRIFTIKPMIKLNVLRAEKKKKMGKMSLFNPNEKTNVTCRSHQESSCESDDGAGKFLGDGEMYGHDAKNCQRERFGKSSRESVISLTAVRDMAILESPKKKLKTRSLSLETEKEQEQTKKGPKSKGSGEKSPRGTPRGTPRGSKE